MGLTWLPYRHVRTNGESNLNEADMVPAWMIASMGQSMHAYAA